MGFQQGLSGLNAASKNLDVIGNNIANANTYGAKVSRAEFADVYANAVSGTSNTIGIGTTLATVSQQFTQGTITTDRQPARRRHQRQRLLRGEHEAGAISYTRNGQFKVDNTGFIVNDQGQRLMGYPADATGTIIPGTASALQMPTAGMTPAVTSTKISMEMNLDAQLGRDRCRRAGVPINFADPSTYNNATSQTVYDAKGQQVALTYYFQKAEHRHLERLRRGQRHADRHRRRQPGAVDDDHLPDQRRRADRAGRHRGDRHSLRHQRRRRDHGADHRHRPRRLGRDRSTARSSASPT